MSVVAKRNVHELETYTGHYVDLLNPDPATICVEDIANHLANICRFGGAVTRFYSVAEHAVRVSRLVPCGLELAGLHHDSHEAYMGDIIAPLKTVFKEAAPGVLEQIALQLDGAIEQALGIWLAVPNSVEHDAVKRADDEAMFHEAAALKYSHGRGEHWGNDEYFKPYAGIGWSPAKAEREFLKRHHELCEQYSSLSRA
jgi:5'-deoxynucleotidase YfbR-like HD superfamily hydrolase